ncbi:hypothetical protein SCYAM73S_05844 [Streptomyces cyaneofuscatus]
MPGGPVAEQLAPRRRAAGAVDDLPVRRPPAQPRFRRPSRYSAPPAEAARYCPSRRSQRRSPAVQAGSSRRGRTEGGERASCSLCRPRRRFSFFLRRPEGRARTAAATARSRPGGWRRAHRSWAGTGEVGRERAERSWVTRWLKRAMRIPSTFESWFVGSWGRARRRNGVPEIGAGERPGLDSGYSGALPGSGLPAGAGRGLEPATARSSILSSAHRAPRALAPPEINSGCGVFRERKEPRPSHRKACLLP